MENFIDVPEETLIEIDDIPENPTYDSVSPEMIAKFGQCNCFGGGQNTEVNRYYAAPTIETQRNRDDPTLVRDRLRERVITEKRKNWGSIPTTKVTEEGRDVKWGRWR